MAGRGRFRLFGLFEPVETFKENGEAALRLGRFLLGQLAQPLLPLATAEGEQPFREVDTVRRQSAYNGTAVVGILVALNQTTLHETVNHACRAGHRRAQLMRNRPHAAIAVAAQGE